MEFDRRVLRKWGILLLGAGGLDEARARADEGTERRLTRVNAVAATAFSLGALLAQAHVGGPRLPAAVFFAGGIFVALVVDRAWASWAGACFAAAAVMQEFERP